MKKHENAIKAILKKGSMPHGFYEDEAGKRYIVNGHVIIKLSGSKLDFVGELPKIYKCGWTDTLNRCIDEAKKGKFEIDININDVKMWDKYGDKIAPYQFIVDKKYMGLSAFYLNKLYTLTDNNIITTTNFKSPVYIAGVDIECVLMPVTLVKGYNENNYNKFITELKGCYIQDEETKKEKVAKKANKAAGIIPTLQPNKNYNGFTMSFYGVDYFILSDAKRITKSIITEFIKAYCKRNNFSDTVLNDMLNSKLQLDNIKARIEKATFILYTNADNSAFTYIDIKTKNAFNGCMYFECDNKLVLIDCVLPTSTETKEETPKTATIQDNAADIVADLETTETKTSDIVKDDTCTDTETAATTETANTKDTTNKLLYDTYPIIHDNDVIEKGGYYINKGNYDYIITQNDFSGVYILYNLNYMHICGTNKDYFETIQGAINYLNAMDQETYFNNLKHLSVEEIYSIYKKYTPCQYHVIRQYIDKWNIKTETMQADARQDTRQTETTQDTTPTQDKPHKTSKKAVSLFVVTDKPQPVKLPTLKQLDRIPMYVERFKTDFKQRNNARVYKYRVNNKKSLKKAYNDFVGTVSCYNDKYAISGDMVAVNTS